MYFLTISEFRAQLSLLPTERVQVLPNDAKGTVFGVSEAGHAFRVQQEAPWASLTKEQQGRVRFMSETPKLVMRFNQERGKIEVDGCLIVTADGNDRALATF